jgi:hypothetical protein
MDIQFVENFAKDTLAEYAQNYPQLQGYSFSWLNSVRTMGKCSYMNRQISLSKPMVAAIVDQSKIVDTLFHEFAHAIVGPGAGHGFLWQMKAKELGAVPEACFNTTGVIDPLKVTKFKWYLVCPNCGYVTGIVRARKRRTACSDCCRKYNFGKFTEKFMFTMYEASSYRDYVNNQSANGIVTE